MWLFLLTEIMFFGGLFTAYLIMRNWYYPAFVEASHQLNIGWGTANTAVLIISSFTMAMGVWSAQMRRKGLLLLFLGSPSSSAWPSSASRPSSTTRNGRSTTFRAFTSATQSFLNPASDPEVYKEYHDKPLSPDMAQKTEMYFFLYFAMTGMHALHMIIGISILGFMIVPRARRSLHHRARHLCRELRPVLALRRYHLDLPVPAAVPDQQILKE